MFYRRRKKKDGGAALVEFAILAPLLLLLVLGIVELSFLFGQFNEVRFAAREGARYAAVSRPDYDGVGGIGDNADVLAVTCDSVDLPGATVSVSLESDGTPARLEYGTITVIADTNSLSGAPLISGFLPDTLTNTATFRLEQDGKWAGFLDAPCP